MPGRQIDTGANPPRLLAQVRAAIRLHGYSPRTEKTYVGWIRRYVRFHGMGHPRELSEPEATAFLTHRAVKRNVSASTQNQALSAIVFLYRKCWVSSLDGSTAWCGPGGRHDFQWCSPAPK